MTKKKRYVFFVKKNILITKGGIDLYFFYDAVKIIYFLKNNFIVV